MLKDGRLNGTSTVGLNKFADWSPEEILQILGSKDLNPKKRKNVFKSAVKVGKYPQSLDWNKKGAVTPVLYQGKCAASWAFAATAYIEAVDFIQNGALSSYS